MGLARKYRNLHLNPFTENDIVEAGMDVITMAQRYSDERTNYSARRLHTRALRADCIPTESEADNGRKVSEDWMRRKFSDVARSKRVTFDEAYLAALRAFMDPATVAMDQAALRVRGLK